MRWIIGGPLCHYGRARFHALGDGTSYSRGDAMLTLISVRTQEDSEAYPGARSGPHCKDKIPKF